MARHALAASMLMLLVAGTALADPASESAELKKRGDELMRELHYREALEVYDRAYAIDHNPAILYNKGRALEALGEYPLALDVLDEFVRVAPDDLKARVPKLAELVSDVRSRVAFVIVNAPVSGATIFIRRKIEGTTPLSAPIRLATGEAEVEVRVTGYHDFQKKVMLEGGKVATIDAALVRESEPAPLVVDKPVAQPTPSGTSGWRIGAYALGGVGIAGLGMGAVFGGLVAAKKSDADPHCPMKACDPTGTAAVNDAKTFATISTASFIAGGVALAAGIALFILAPKHTKTSALVIGPGSVGLGGVF